MKVALITGITGQDGAYLARLLLGKGYKVHGILRRSSSFNTKRIDDIFENLNLHYGDITDTLSLIKILEKSSPDEVYNLAAQSHVAVSFELPEYTAQTDAVGLLRLLEAIKTIWGYSGTPRFYQASTSEIFGSSPSPQNEDTPFKPISPYGCAKLYAHWTARMYREAYGLHVSNGILFNHESPLRGETFVTQKIIKGLIRVKRGKQKKLFLGNLDSKRDWGHAKDYVEAMWLMLQQPYPDDYVIATGIQHTIREFLELAAIEIGVSLDCVHDEIMSYTRPLDVIDLRGDATKAFRVLGWKPKIYLNDLIKEMIQAALQEA